MPLWSYAHPPAIELAERVAAYAPGDLNRVFFTSGGGEAVETAWKLAKNYYKLTGEPMKHKVISRAIAYHGTTQGALSITGLPFLKQQFEPLVPSTFRVPNTNYYRSTEHGSPEGLTPEQFGRWAADQIAIAIENEGPDTVAAVFLEPVQNAGGCFPPPPGYFDRVREICDQYDVLLVSDEVICAFGRLGHMFGADRFGYQPDIITCAKGITSGYAPLGAMIASDRLMEPFLEDGAMFAHGYTFGGHPVSTAVALANLDIFESENAPGPRPRQRGRLPRHARAPEGPADRRRRPRRGLLLRHRARQGQGHQGDLQRRGVRADPLRRRVQGALRGGPLLPGRRPRRPGRAAGPAADLRPDALRRDRADPARRPRQGTQPPVSGSGQVADIEQARRLVTAIPGPRSQELHARKAAAVSSGVGRRPAGVRRARRRRHPRRRRRQPADRLRLRHRGDQRRQRRARAWCSGCRSRSRTSPTPASWSRPTRSTSRSARRSPSSPPATTRSAARCSTPAPRRSRTRSRSPAPSPGGRPSSRSTTATTGAPTSRWG